MESAFGDESLWSLFNADAIELGSIAGDRLLGLRDGAPFDWSFHSRVVLLAVVIGLKCILGCLNVSSWKELLDSGEVSLRGELYEHLEVGCASLSSLKLRNECANALGFTIL